MTFAVGDKWTAADARSVRVMYLKKAANETLTTSTTLQNDNDIVLTIDPGTVYRVELVFAATGPTGADIKLAWAATSTVTSPTGRHCIGPDTSITSIATTSVRASATHGLTTSVSYGTDGSGPSAIREDLIVDGGASGGTLTLQWAQNASSGTTTVYANTFAVVTVVESL